MVAAVDGSGSTTKVARVDISSLANCFIRNAICLGATCLLSPSCNCAVRQVIGATRRRLKRTVKLRRAGSVSIVRPTKSLCAVRRHSVSTIGRLCDDRTGADDSADSDVGASARGVTTGWGVTGVSRPVLTVLFCADARRATTEATNDVYVTRAFLPAIEPPWGTAAVAGLGGGDRALVGAIPLGDR